MATIGTLVVNITLNNQQFLTQINQTNQATQRAMSQMARSASNVDRAFLILRRTFLSFFAVSSATAAAKTIADYADAWKLATNQIAAANSIATLQARSMESLNVLAAETRTSLADTAELYARLLRSTEGVAKSEEEVAEATRIVSMAFKAGGASMQEAANGARQLGQSLASGMFQGDELRSIRENAPLLAQAIATEFNTTIGGLKALGAAGKLTADRVFKAILENSKPIKDAFASTNATIADSFTVLNNSISEYIGEMDKALGASKSFTQTILELAKTLRDASKAPTGTSELENFVRNLKIITDTYARMLSLQQRQQPTVINLDAMALGLIDKFRQKIEELTGAVVTYNATQARRGVGGVNMPPVLRPVPKPGATQDILDLKQELRNQLLLQEAAAKSKDAYEDLKIQMEAENEVLKKFGTLSVRSGAAGMLALELATRRAAAETEDLLKGQIKVFAQSQGRTGLGAPGPGVVPAFPASGGRTGIPDARFPTKEARDFNRELEAVGDNWRRLHDAALMGSKALQLTKDVIEAENDALAAGHRVGTDAYNTAVYLGVANKQLARSVEEVTDAFSEMESVQRNINQQKELQSALRVSVVAFNEATLRIEAFNFALAKGGDGTTEFERGLASLKYEELKAKETTDALTESIGKVPDMINSTVTSAIGQVSSAFADAVVEGENFRDMIDSLLKDLTKLMLNTAMQFFLKQLIGQAATPGTPGTGLFGAAGFHSGGIVGGTEGKHRTLSAALVATAPRFHGGLMSGEFPAILKKGEGVFTADQMKALGGNDVVVNINNNAPGTSTTQQKTKSGGSTQIDVFIDKIDAGLGARISGGNSSIGAAMDNTRGLRRIGR